MYKQKLIDLITSTWAPMQYLAQTKRGEATTNHGNKYEDKNKVERIEPPVKFSIMGAIYMVTESRALPNDAAKDLIKRITEKLPEGTAYISNWEDTKGRTKEEVIALVESI